MGIFPNFKLFMQRGNPFSRNRVPKSECYENSNPWMLPVRKMPSSNLNFGKAR